MKKVLAFCMTACFLISCRSVPMASLEQDHEAKTFKPTQDQANIYIYRNEFMGNQVKIDLTMDGQFIGRTLGDTFMLLKVPAGKHSIMSEAENKSTIDVTTEKGKNYYVWQEVKMGVWIARTQLHQVQEEEGQKGVNECKLIQQVKD